VEREDGLEPGGQDQQGHERADRDGDDRGGRDGHAAQPRNTTGTSTSRAVPRSRMVCRRAMIFVGRVLIFARDYSTVG
jgi:hypothetical protein